MPTHPTFWNRMCAAMVGEVSADTLEAYRRASLAVYDALDHANAHRRRAKSEGKNAWTIDASTQAEILCTWNAFVLQTLGDRILEADYSHDPQTVGFVPPITADQILSFYTQVEPYLNRAEQAHHNPDYQLDIAVPAQLPEWSRVEPCPNAHLFGMLEAMRAVREHTEAAFLFLTETPPATPEQTKGLNQIRQLHAAAQFKARYADDMVGDTLSRDVHERVEEHVKDAIEGFFLLGQLLAMPDLASKIQTASTPDSKPEDVIPDWNSLKDSLSDSREHSGKTLMGAARLPGPNEAGFDMWCLTDPASLEKFRNDAEARRALKTLWRLDPDPKRTLEIQAEINDALERGDIDIALDRYGKRLGHFFCAPWAPVYVVLRSLTLGGRRLKTMQQFIYNVTCEGVNLGAPFEREIMVGNFTPTTKMEYGDPNEEPDH
jgi:hypothetical protein